MIETELDVLRDVSHRLGSAGIGFMLTGSVEMNTTRSRAWPGIDLVVALEETEVATAGSELTNGLFGTLRAGARGPGSIEGGGAGAVKDTPREIAKHVRELIMARSGTDRLLMGSHMFEVALTIISHFRVNLSFSPPIMTSKSPGSATGLLSLPMNERSSRRNLKLKVRL